MLTLTPQNIKALDTMQLWDFHYGMAEHCRNTFPERCNSYSDKELHALVKKGVNRAKHYGFNQKGSVRLYIELILLLGEDFDITQHWAHQCLNDEDFIDPYCRAVFLHKKACEYIESYSSL